MKPYKNLSGNSSVIAYEYDLMSIRVKFNNGWIYEYTVAKLGEVTIREMKQLADAGRGLGSYISSNRPRVYKGWSRRFKWQRNHF